MKFGNRSDRCAVAIAGIKSRQQAREINALDGFLIIVCFLSISALVSVDPSPPYNGETVERVQAL
jgi:hypothetical protein